MKVFLCFLTARVMPHSLFPIILFILLSLTRTTTALALPVADLSLMDVVAQAIKTNPEVRDAYHDWLIRRNAVVASLGEFEPQVFASYNREGLKRENTSQESVALGGLPVYDDLTDKYSTGLKGALPTGAEYKLAYTLNSIRSNINPRPGREYEAFTGADLSQPLLKGAWSGAPMVKTRLALEDRVIGYHQYRQKLMAGIYQVQAAYWNLAFAQQKFCIASDTYHILKWLLDDGRVRHNVGKMSEAELLDIRSEFLQGLAARCEAYEDQLVAMNQLKITLGYKREYNSVHKIRVQGMSRSGGWIDKQMKVHLERLSEDELNWQPDIMIKIHELERDKMAYRYYLNQSFPEVNVNGRYGYNGYGRDNSVAWHEIQDHNYPAWSVGFEVKVPLLLGFKERRELDSARIKRKKSEESFKQTRFAVMAVVNTLVTRVKLLNQRVKAYQTASDIKKSLLNIEIRKMKMGLSHNRLVYEVNEKYADTRKKTLEQQVRYYQMVQELALTRGSLLIDNNLESYSENTKLYSKYYEKLED